MLASAAFNWVYHLRVVDRLQEIERQQEDPHVLTTKWMSGGLERSWTSTIGEHVATETIAELALRHKRELVELQIALPRDP